MKTPLQLTAQYITGIIILLLLPLFLTSCEDKRVQTIKWVEYEPVYMSQEEFANSVELKAGRDLEKPGKIYFYNGYLFINERNEGVHIIDNRNPESPQNVGFINIPASKDLAVVNDRLYADSQSDLLVFDIQNLEQAELIKRVEDVFETSAEMAPGFTTQSVDHSMGVVVDWKKVMKEEVCEGDCNSHPARPFRCVNCGVFMNEGFSAGAADASFGANSGGTGGSMARFTINGDYLYAVDHQNLLTFNIVTSPATPVDRSNIGWAIETIFPYGNNLFIGSESAMYIYELSNPAMPQKLSVYPHSTACDPIVVEGDFAFVTLRDGERCPQGVNRLEVVDVEDLTRPEKVAFYEMLSPHGLGIDNGYLFISEGDHGLKIMDARDPYDVQQLRHIKDLRTYDVIPFDGVLMVTGDDGIVQYDYTDINDLKHLSTIPVIENNDDE
ncbi:MAG: hypothetical protein WD604_17235 [Balneolaceae bacterium]